MAGINTGNKVSLTPEHLMTSLLIHLCVHPQKLESSEAVSIISTFDGLGLKEDLVHGIYAYSSLHAISRLVVFLDLNNYSLLSSNAQSCPSPKGKT